MNDGKKADLRIMDSVMQDPVVSGATGLGLCSARQDTDGVRLEVTGAGEESSTSDETLVIKSVDTEVESRKEFGATDSLLVTGAFWSDSSCQSSRHVAQETSGRDDFGDFESVVMSEDFAVFDSPLADGTVGNWAPVSQPVSSAIHNSDYGCEFNDFETAEPHSVPVNCAGLDNGEVSICCKN